jgi:hypothetical protein
MADRRAIPCTYCSAPATHSFFPDMATRRWTLQARPFDPQARGVQQGYCLRCGTALADGESGEALARRLNQEAETSTPQGQQR